MTNPDSIGDRGSPGESIDKAAFGPVFRAEQVAVVFHNSLAVLISTLVIAPVVAFALWPTGEHVFLVSWAAMVYAVTLARGGLYFAFRHYGGTVTNERWHHYLVISTMTGGAVWGVPWAIFPTESDITWIFIGLFLTGMAMAAMMSYFVSPAAYRAYALAAIAPYAIASFVRGGEMGIALSILAVVFLVTMSIFARSAHGVFFRSVLTRHQNSTLVERVSLARADAEKANRAKSDFLASMSHELRTPLNAIIGFSDIMRRQIFGPISNTTYKEYAEDIHSSGTHLLALVNDILDLSKAEAGQMVANEDDVDMNRILAQALQMLRGQAEALDITLSVSNNCRTVGLRADPRFMIQILLNLVTNSIHFIDGKGRVDVDATLDPASGEYVLTVADNGIGMEPHEIPLALARFGQVGTGRRRNTTGTGLGLSLVRHMVELHGGSIRIDSARGVGTTVEIRLPASRVIAMAPPVKPAAETA